MASTVVQLFAPSGLTLTLQLYAHGSDTIGNTGGDTLTEATNRKGLYTATVTEALSGLYSAHVFASSTLVAVGWVWLEDTTDTYTVRETPGEVVGSTFWDETGVAQAGASSSITLRSGASSSAEFYKYAIVRIVKGTGAGQSRQITAYNGTTKVATVETAWVTTPDSTSVYQVLGRVV